MFEDLLKLDTISLNFSQGSALVMNIAIGFLMFGVALELKWIHFKNLLTNPKPMIVGLSAQFILLPLITFLVVLLLKPWITPAVAFGMILVAACPGGNVSNFITNFSKSNTALGVSLTAIGTVLAIVMTPFNFSLYGHFYSATSYLNQPLNIPLPDVLRTVFVILGIPVLLGLLASNYLPKFTQKIKQPVSIISGFIFIAFIVFAFAGNMDNFLKYIKWIFLIVLIHNAFIWISSYQYARVFRLCRYDRRTIAIESAIQNSGLGLALLFNPKVFPEDLQIGGMVFIVAWWGVWHIVAGGAVSLWWRYVLPLKKFKD